MLRSEEVLMQAGKKRKFSGHCEEFLLTSTFKKHKDMYYDALAKTWTRREDILTQRPTASTKDACDEQIIAGITRDVTTMQTDGNCD